MEKEGMVILQNEISDQKCEAFSKAFVSLLAGTFHLHLKNQYLFWNAAHFDLDSMKHVFEGQSVELAEAAERIAHRIRTIGFYAPACFSKLLKVIALENRTAISNGLDMVQTLVNEHESLMRSTETVLVFAEQLHDQDTVELLNERFRAHQRGAWALGERMIRSEIIYGMKEKSYGKIKTILFQDSL